MKTLNISGLKKKMMKKARKLKWSVLKRKECNDITNKSLTQPIDNEGEKFDFLVYICGYICEYVVKYILTITQQLDVVIRERRRSKRFHR